MHINYFKCFKINNSFFYFLPTYSQRKKALKFFILLSITLNGKKSYIILENRSTNSKKHEHYSITVLNLLQKFICFQGKGSNCCDSA